ncbi:MAG: carboxymuconolactone decarboxylase family protein [Octadecabacter sp.]|jgi:4-carboxymuconolactone decarboxylase|nr:carboxymuconolactone decarboxylase family protein [Octadecabacter sp.]MDC1229726.1 carboxymuconolactone decarboxylase family protein [Octadecabacter sp.]MDC1297613.1 carboxymuconolactone decarboxylase family protein [Octadecabacter sp.]|tara:strand:- start:234 stop:812 length:579 start_codon:yes stop_codon:yes gene_type:complete
MSRLPELDEAALTAHQQKVFDDIASGPRGNVYGPLRVWLQSPGLAETAQALGQYARYDSALPEHLSELAILVTARYWSSGFEWSHHAPIALQVGVPEQAVTAIAHARQAEFDDPQMQAVFDFAVDLHLNKKVSDKGYDGAHAALGVQACVDLVGICGYYTLISMTINVFDVEDGDGPTLPKLDMPIAAYFRN